MPSISNTSLREFKHVYGTGFVVISKTLSSLQSFMMSGMKKRNILIFSALLTLLMISACGVGRKHYNKGNYLKATYAAINRLKRDPDSEKAGKMLQKSYKALLTDELNQVNRLKSNQQPFRYDQIIPVFERLNRVRDEIESCPGCLKIIPAPKGFDNELLEARSEAAREHYSQGIRLMDGDMNQARQAHGHFIQAKQHRPDLERIDDWIIKAREKATIRVLIEPIPMHSRSLSLSNEFFEQQIMQFARNQNLPFVQFLSPLELSESDLRPHHVIVMRFDDFVVGQTLLREETREYKKDSVEVGKVTLEGGKTIPAYGTVKANYTRFSKTVKSTGLLDFRIMDYQTGAVIRQQKFPGTHVWEYQWANFNGDERALSKEQLELSRRREIMPPMPQDLFIEFTRPIHAQITTAIRNHYRQYQ